MPSFHQEDIFFNIKRMPKDLTNKGTHSKEEIETSFYSRRMVGKFAIDHSFDKFRNSNFALKTFLRMENWLKELRNRV